ncbi:MAG: dATP/dGTP diphosphohydrolase domain-containing protein [Acidobacteriota bacterium]
MDTAIDTTPEQGAILDVKEAEAKLTEACRSGDAAVYTYACNALMGANDRLAMIQGKPGRLELEQRAAGATAMTLPEFLEHTRPQLTCKIPTGSALPDDSAKRKDIPLFSGVVRYFPAALIAVAKVSQFGNMKHNPGSKELLHSRGISADHADCILRHLIDMDEGSGVDKNNLPAVAMIAWRALALCQVWYETHAGAPLAPAAVLPVDSGEFVDNYADLPVEED